MQKTCLYSGLSLGLWLTLAGCSDPAQFKELPTGEDALFAPDAVTIETQAKTSERSNDPTPSQPEDQSNPDLSSNPVSSPEAEVGDNPSNQATPGSSSPGSQHITSAPPSAPIFDDCDASPNKSIVAGLYVLPSDTRMLPNFSSLEALRTVCLSQLNIKDRNFTEGFPGVEGLVEWFGLDMNFRVEVPVSGKYEFSLLADDGAILWIDDKKVIDADGVHAVIEKRAKVTLTEGTHEFHLQYFQGPRWRIALELYWKLPGAQSRTYIPSSAISRP